MSVVVILIGASLLVAAGFLGAFIWAVKNDQYSDLVSPSLRMLFDDRPESPVNQAGSATNKAKHNTTHMK